LEREHGRVEAAEGLGGGKGELVSDVGVVGFSHAVRGDTETEEAGVESRELRFDGSVGVGLYLCLHVLALPSA
jgi:hypothetical protein